MSDIVERLKSQDELYHQPNFGWEIDENKIEPLCMEAAAEILRLRAENEKLRDSLRPFADILEKHGGFEKVAIDVAILYAAAAALKVKSDD